MVWLLNVKLGAVQSTYMAKLEIENWSAAYRAHCRSISCAFPAAYRAQLRRYPALAHVALCNLRTVRCVYLHLNHFVCHM